MQSIKNHLIAVLFFTLIISAGFARPFALVNNVKAAEWYDNSWSFRKLITINSDEVDSNLSNFPIYLDLNDFGTDFFNSVKSDGSDIVITSSDGITKLNRELVSLDTGSETGEIWFSATSLSATLDTNFYLYYGNTSANETNETATWDSNYQLVYHLNEDPSTPSDGDCAGAETTCDSTSNDRDGTSQGSMTNTDLIEAKVGYGYEFDGVNDNIAVGTFPNLSGDLTIEAWVYPTDLTGRFYIFGDMGGLGQRGYQFNVTETGIALGASYNGNTYLSTESSAGAVTIDNWYHIVYTRSSGNQYIYLNGNIVGTSSHNPAFSVSNASPSVGCGWSTGGANCTVFANGIADEVRVSNAVRSADWISTEYNNQNDTSSFYTISSQDTYGSADLVIAGITDNEWDGVSQTEVCFEYFPSAEFAASDAVSFAFNPVFSSPVLDATPAEDDADGDTTTDGSFTSLTADGATYTFTDATTQATTNGINLCLDLPAGQSINSHSISMTDTNGSFGATLLHVADNNDVTVTLEITPTLSFNIRTLDDSADTNVCDLGTIDTTTLPNTDTTDDGNGECGYSLAIGTNATSGFQVQITSDGDMNNASSSIINATEDQSIAAGAEAYGLINITAAQTGSDGGGNFDQIITEDGDFADDNDYTPVPQAPTNFVSYTDGVDYLAGTDATDVTRVMHGMTVGTGTPAGLYQQIVTYTTTVTF